MLPFLKHLVWSILYDAAAGMTALKAIAVAAGVLFLVRVLRRWPVLQPVFHALWYDPDAWRRWLWGIGGFLVTLAPGVLLGSSIEEAMTWPMRRWVAQIVSSLIAMGVAMVNPAGKKKPDGAAQ